MTKNLGFDRKYCSNQISLQVQILSDFLIENGTNMNIYKRLNYINVIQIIIISFYNLI